MNDHPWSAATAASLAWFDAARFGLFVHWGLYSVAAGSWAGREVPYIGEWIQHEELIPAADYGRLGSGFTAAAFDPQAWVAAARRAGMRYLVLTAKHHEGFALWHSRCDRFNSVEAAASGRDLVAELAEACRAGGIRLGLYYSHCVDWHEAHGGNLPEDVKEAGRPLGRGRLWGNDWDFAAGTAAGFDAYLRRKVEPQLSELLSGYGDIALIWFDTPTASLQPEQSRRLRDLIKRHQPGCLVGGRIGHGFQDFDCLGDNQVPHSALTRPGESCMTLNDTWGYKAHDHDWASAETVVGLLGACAATNCNLLLNVGPMADGRLPQTALDRLAEVGEWMDGHHDAICGTHAAPLPSEPAWGHATLAGNQLHLLITDPLATSVSLPCPLAAITAVSSGGQLVAHERLGDWLRLSLPTAGPLPRHITVSCASPPNWDPTPSENPDGALVLPACRARTADGQAWSGQAAAGQRLRWTLRCAKPGRFRVTVVCGGERYGDWYGEHAVELRCGASVTAGTLRREQAERGRRWQHYPAYGCMLGELTLNAGEQELTLLVNATSGPEPASIPVIRLQRIP